MITPFLPAVRDSQLTDYDISDFNAHEEPHYHTVLTPQQQFQQAQQQQTRPSAIQEERRRTTADSDDYVKVSEPIYDYPPPKTPEVAVAPKRISPTEAAQLQELYQEYDLGLDLPGVVPIGVGKQGQQGGQGAQPPFGQAGPQHGAQAQPPFGQAVFGQQGQAGQAGQGVFGQAGQAGQHGQPPFGQPAFAQQGPQHGAQGQPPFGQAAQAPFGQGAQPPFGQQGAQGQPIPPPRGQGIVIRQNSVPDSPRTIINVPISRKTDVPIQIQQVQVQDDPRNLATADLFVQDALEYIGHQGHPDKPQFVMEEEMLSAHEPVDPSKKKLAAKNPSFEATSRQVRTNDVFERVENDEHDDMTYAPEIQSVEIPPDQMSETSENMIDYFDKVAAESEQQIQQIQQQQQHNTLKKQQQTQQMIDATIPDSSLLKPVGRAPQILPAFGNRAPSNSSLGSGTGRSGSAVSSSDVYPYRHLRKQSSLLSVLGVTSMQEMLLTITSLDSLSEAMRKAGLETTNLIFGIDYTASNKYQGEESFGGRSLHTIHPHVKNPYQQVITILGRTLAPFAGQGKLGVYGFGDAKTGDWSVFNLKGEGDCRSLDEVLNVYNTVTPNVALSGPTNFAPLIYQAMETCQKSRDYHILVIIADGQVTNERATRRAIVQACQHPLSIIVVGVGDGPWDMMRIFDESLPKRPWDNFHFVEFHDIIKKSTSLEDGDVKVAVQSLLEIPDQYRCICELGLLDRSIPPRGSEIRREMMHNPL
ncbi:hypothetical protein CAEBREN_28449 [Caenorhabditis brenneri]|uniref:VWFA domain-containing protein n=1 Tax=Caenorhabditis brenneri TaxID=135651 RepID=G0PJD7_CAEBE|nr:hypothetical protein CAEBREN_28449 [Caenorhabditis brenneri]